MSAPYALKTVTPHDGTITLCHPGLPGVMVTIKPGLLRRLGLRTSPVATLSETYGTASAAQQDDA